MAKKIMKCVQPLPPLCEGTLNTLREIYEQCDRRIEFHRPGYGAKLTNYFIDDLKLFEAVLEKVIDPLGLEHSEIENMWNSQDPEYKCRGINFNVLRRTDYLKPHIDYNPTKLNILISGSTENPVIFVEENETWDWSTPALIDISKLHYVSSNTPITTPRVMMQIFLTKPFSYYRETINLNPKW